MTNRNKYKDCYTDKSTKSGLQNSKASKMMPTYLDYNVINYFTGYERINLRKDTKETTYISLGSDKPTVAKYRMMSLCPFEYPEHRSGKPGIFAWG